MIETVTEYVSVNFDKVFFSLITIIVLTAAILDIRDKNYPPGPLGVPFFGYLPFLNSKAPYLTLTELAQQYGRVFSVNFGSVYAVVVADAKLLRQAFSQEELNKRAPLLVNLGVMNGILNAEGQEWKEHRDFVMKALSQLSTPDPHSKMNVVETCSQQRIGEFVSELRRTAGHRMDIGPALRDAVGLVYTDMILGSQFDKNNEDFKSIISTVEACAQVSGVARTLNYLPWMRNFTRDSGVLKSYRNGSDMNHTIFARILDSKIVSPQKNLVCSILEAYAVELKSRRGDQVGTFTSQQIQYVLSDLIEHSWDTSITTLKWLYLYMALYPDVQENIAAELKKVAGDKGQVTVNHFERLPYTEATVMEIWRHRSIIPLGIPRATHEQTKIGDHLVPKGAMVVPLLWTMNHDRRLWEKPDIFCPERFLNEDGTICRNKNLYPFQTGNRSCIGSDIGRWIVQLFFTNTVNQMKISLPKGYYYNIEEAPDCGMTLTPKPYQLAVESRYN